MYVMIVIKNTCFILEEVASESATATNLHTMDGFMVGKQTGMEIND